MSHDRSVRGSTALVIGGTRFIGRHVVSDLLEHEYDVTLFNRGRHANPFADDDRVAHVKGDRRDESSLAEARDVVDPEVVIDCVAYHPAEVRTATEIFADVGAYVYVSSGATYAVPHIPKREDETPLHDCTPEQAADDTMATYGPRKAAGDRAVFDAAEQGCTAMSVRPTIVYGPYDYSGRFDYWIAQVRDNDRVLIPGDGTNIWHRVYVEDVAAALRIVAERGMPGQAYNCGDQRLVTLVQSVERFADALGTTVDPLFASRRELASADLEPAAFPVYRAPPHLLATNRLEALGWSSTALPTAYARTVEEFQASDRDGQSVGPARETRAALRTTLRE